MDSLRERQEGGKQPPFFIPEKETRKKDPKKKARSDVASDPKNGPES